MYIELTLKFSDIQVLDRIDIFVAAYDYVSHTSRYIVPFKTKTSLKIGKGCKKTG